MDISAAQRELEEAIAELSKGNFTWAEHLISNVLIKVRVMLHEHMKHEISLAREEFLKRVSTDQQGRRVYQVLPPRGRGGVGSATAKHKKPKVDARPRRAWTDQLD